MLNEIQKKQFTARAKEETQKLLKDLNITKLQSDNIGKLQDELDTRVAGLVSAEECENQKIDEELLKIYDLLIDIIIDNEKDLPFLNNLFLK